MNGFKFKLAHKRTTKGEWNINEKSQRKQLIKILNNFIAEMETGEITEEKMPETFYTCSVKASAKKKVSARTSEIKKKVLMKEAV